MSQTFRSWQQIASYVGKGTRTVQRWEREIDFPVHRPCAGDGRQVIAFADEIDQWMGRSNPATKSANSVEDALAARRGEMLKLRQQVERMREQTNIIRDRLMQLQQTKRRSGEGKREVVSIMSAGKS